MSQKSVILSTAYLPPVQYFAKIIASENTLIEAFETYSKQSYRNRCIILTCNGNLALTVPVIKTNGNNTSIKDIEIDYSINWQKNHWKAIESAYRTSAYYDFVADLLIPFYTKNEKSLFNLNLDLTTSILNFLNIDKPLLHTEEYLKSCPSQNVDCRNSIHPKQKFHQNDVEFEPIKYFQVYNDRFSFCPNLSIIDLLFNEGLDSLKIIEESIVK
jgi:hypothetical protein